MRSATIPLKMTSTGLNFYNNSSVAVDIGAYEITMVTEHGKDEDLVGLQDKDDDGQDIMLGAGEYSAHR